MPEEVDGALLLALRSTATEEYDFKPSPETELESGMTMILMGGGDRSVGRRPLGAK